MAESSWLPVPIVILCLMLSMLLLYFVAGSLVRYRKGMRCFPEVLPNYRCWCSLVDGILLVLTCGRCKPCYNLRRGHYRPHHTHTHPGGVGNGSPHSFVLPPRPTRARDLAFEALQSDWEEEFGDIDGAMQPSNAVTASYTEEKGRTVIV